MNAVIPSTVANKCPPGTKLHVLHLGYLQADAGWFLRGANTSLMSNPNPHKNKEPERRDLVMYCCLIDIPGVGPILWETGCGKDYPEIWGAPVNDIFARSKYDESQELDAALGKIGYKISDIKAVVIGHLHLDHAGGLMHFKDTDVPIWVHKLELENAFYSCATGADDAVYQAHYLLPKAFNWKTFDDRTVDFAPGLTLHHLPGHTVGLCGLQINLINDGTFIFVSDHGHVKENIWPGVPQGWLARDHQAWWHSNQRLLRLEQATAAKVIPGHDEDIATPLFGKVFT
ncbi:Metallo-hydrolase/oxidoreductase [Tilletiopsis washingtonensis]|uniref:Metallo-hydrolase/oxidoreductase n=1 Tax=Tilletiopsis washingtonensis TaxID=58919 RepID=A0A316Z8R9_9BASI|nr:Metallo-hydrolase/oxidoreductase [Tilletiopsis washingtonensis]PWN96635.1 Metallo-hydrolase/oxidoreductase [Tilletiopsis washingtonensis]